jgi:tetraprenyl-beta-curcumene synthase
VRLAKKTSALICAARALAIFVFTVLPRVQDQLVGWSSVARSIPDLALRDLAVQTLECKSTNVEAAAVFATLSPRRARGAVVALLVGLQVLTDFLDTVSEEPCGNPLGNSLALHRALVDAVETGDTIGDYYAHHPGGDDGGYVAGLVRACRAGLAQLPATAVVRPLAVQAAVRCGEGQSYTHAALHSEDVAVVESWAKSLASAPGYRWWEVAAGASSSVAIHALVAAAADRRTTTADAARIDALYYLSVGSLTVLLDNLVDREHDLASDGHNYLGYYRSPEEAGSRLASIADDARAATRALRVRSRHEAIVAGVLGFYLSSPGAHSPYARVIASQLLERAGPAVWLILWAMRARRRLSR